MNKRTFLKHLEKRKGMFYLNDDDQIRTKENFNVVNSTSSIFNSNRRVCPIECLTLGNGTAQPVRIAGSNLGLDNQLEQDIIDCADVKISYLAPRLKSLRKSMLRVLNLQEKQ